MQSIYIACASVVDKKRISLTIPSAMKINSRFGTIQVDAEDCLFFPAGLCGLEDCRQWVLLADSENVALAWLQSVDRPGIALPVTSPRRFLPGYQMRVSRRELLPLELEDTSAAKVLVIVGTAGQGSTLNLKAPLVINLHRRLGRQVIANGDLPVRYEIIPAAHSARKTA